MALRFWARSAIAASLLMAFANPIDLESCGPFIPSAVFVRPGIPENPDAFYKGQLGVLLPTYWRRYLAVAYRIMSGLPVPTLTFPPAPSPNVWESWFSARHQVSGVPDVAVGGVRVGADFNSYENCNDDAVRTAVATLEDRIRVAGANSPEVHDWLAAQDAVFSNCGGKGAIPVPAPSGSSVRIRTDRAYQIAAAHFYAGDYDAAKSLFQEIARDSDSPWRTIAPYLVARADIRKEDLSAAEADLEHILADPKLLAIHSKADALLELVLGRMDPSRGLDLTSKHVLSANSTNLEQYLESFTFLYDKIVDRGKTPDNKDDLISWIEVMQGRDSEDQAIEHWQRDHAVAWLVAALQHASKSTAQVPELITAGLAVPASSPAWATARFHAVRLLVDTDKIADVRKALDDVTPHMTSLSRSSQNAFSSEMMETAATLETFLKSAVRLPSGTVSDTEVEDLTPDQQSHRLLGVDAADAFNLDLPLDTWLQAARQTQVPKDLRKHIAQTGFVRALLLKNAIAADFAQLVAQLSPDDVDGMRKFIAATQPDDRFYDGVFWLLHRPGVSNTVRGGLLRNEKDQEIDSYRDNWWDSHKDAPAPLTSFLSAAQKKQGADEAKKLASLGSARFFLVTNVLAWAQARPDDPRLPEALAMTIRMSHYSPEDPTADASVERAFGILHKRFPNSTWAKQTLYWYK